MAEWKGAQSSFTKFPAQIHADHLVQQSYGALRRLACTSVLVPATFALQTGSSSGYRMRWWFLEQSVPHIMHTCNADVSSTHMGRNSIPVRRPDSQSREPGFKSHCCRFEPLASLITPHCHSSFSCINDYLALQTVVDM